MTIAELRVCARRELIRNALISPIVLFVRLPLGLIYMVVEAITKALVWANDWLPGWRTDYARALRWELRDERNNATLQSERPEA